MDEYRFYSMTEPKDEYLHQLMQEAAQDAKMASETAHKAYFSKINSMIQSL